MPIDPLLFKQFQVKEAAKAAETPKVVMEPLFPVKPAVTPAPATKPAAGTEVALVAAQPAAVEPVIQPTPANFEMEPLPVLVVEAAPDIGFKDRLDELDRLCMSEFGVSKLTVDAIRGHVMVIMKTLQTEPELDNILIDRDVHNILTFIRFVKNEAVASRESTQAKKETKAKKALKLGGFTMDAFVPLSLEGLGNLKT